MNGTPTNMRVPRPPHDEIDHPAHYNQGKIEVIEFIEDQHLGFHLGNAVKYIARAGKKNPEKRFVDIEKAIWYLERYVDYDCPNEHIDT